MSPDWTWMCETAFELFETQCFIYASPRANASAVLAAAAHLLAVETTNEAVTRAAGWLIGANDHGAVLYDAEMAGCPDGLTSPTGVDLKRGAESTLAGLGTLQQADRSVVRIDPICWRRTS